MTDILSSVLRERADSTPAPHLDLDSIISAGNRRAGRARVATGLGAMAVTGALAAGVTVLPGLLPSSPPPAGQAAGSAPAFTERRVGFAEGSLIHWGTETFDLGAPVRSYVQTDDGFVYASRDGEVRLFDGVSATAIGAVSDGRLRADDTGSLVVWADGRDGGPDGTDGGPQFVVYDTAGRSTVTRLTAPGDDSGDDVSPSVVALDDGTVYLDSGTALTRHDVATGDVEVLATYATPTDPATKGEGGLPDVVDVANGRLAFTRDADGARMFVGTSVEDAAPMPTGWHGVLSPDGTHLAVEEADETAVYRTADAVDVSPDLSDYAFWVVYGWSGDDTALVLAIDDHAGGGPGYDTDFLSCGVGTGECATVTSAALDERAVLPVGDPAS